MKKNKYEYIYYDIKYKILKGKNRLILFSAILFFIQSILMVITFRLKCNTWILEIAFDSLFYYLILKVKLYKHHYLSAILIIIIGLVIDLVLRNLQDNLSNNFLFLLFRLIREICS